MLLHVDDNKCIFDTIPYSMNKHVLAILALALMGPVMGASTPAQPKVPFFNGDTTARKDAGSRDYGVALVNAIRTARRGNKAPTPAQSRHRLPQIVILNKGH